METNKERQNLPLQEDAAKSTVLRKVKMLMDECGIADGYGEGLRSNALFCAAKRVIDKGLQFPPDLFPTMVEGWLLSHEDTGIGLYRLREFWPQAYSEVLNEATLMFWDRLHRTV